MASTHVIWTDDVDYSDWKDDLEAEYPELTDSERYEKMYEINASYLDDERCNLDIQLTRPIIVIGDLGLWNGRRSGYKEIESGNIRDCLYSDCEYNTWYVDKSGDLCCVASHHDGTNFYTYRVFKPDVTEAQMENLKDKIYHGTATRSDITRVTNRLGDEIGKVYGWDIGGRKPDQKTADHGSR